MVDESLVLKCCSELASYEEVMGEECLEGYYEAGTK